MMESFFESGERSLDLGAAIVYRSRALKTEGIIYDLAYYTGE
jgi:hypothetical protein